MLQYFLMPPAWLYGMITGLRNRLYDNGFFESYRSPLKTIVIGNLQVGGAGKTPHTAMLYKWLSSKYKTAVLLRGYGRKSKGLKEVTATSYVSEVGDEASWYFEQLKDVTVVVAEERATGLKYLEKKGTQLVLLDDAYQHRAVTCNVKLLLTEFSKPYYNDHVMPWGRLREWKTGDKRADIIIVTKCPQGLTLEEKIEMINEINPFDYQQVFFTALKPGLPYSLKGATPFDGQRFRKVLAVSGIANPDQFSESCLAFGNVIETLAYNDHHDYTVEDINKMIAMAGVESIILTTEKDAVKLKQQQLFSKLPENKIYVVPVMPVFLFNEENKFKEALQRILK